MNMLEVETEQDVPLDLSMDAVDLSNPTKVQNNKQYL